MFIQQAFFQLYFRIDLKIKYCVLYVVESVIVFQSPA